LAVRSVSAAFETAILTSHTLAVSAEVIAADGTETSLPIVEGTVTLDQRAAVRGRCDLMLADDGTLGFIPDDGGDLLAPYGNEVRVSRGITFPDGTTELVSLGVFRIQEALVDDGPEGLTVRIAGLDRAQRFVDARFEEPYQVAAGTNYATAIESVLTDAWPDVPTSFQATSLTTPTLVVQEGDDRWAFAQAMARSLGMALYFDGDGTAVLTPDVLSSPVIELAEGAGGVLLLASRQWTREGTFNRVIATGENTGETAPARGVATDDNPLSPTYYFGPFGKVPNFYPSPFITTDAQAEAAAQSILDREIGTTESVGFGALVLPHLEPGDTATITRERSGIDEDHVIDSLTIPLSASEGMSGQTRARAVTS
jgi:hypothetical protein